MNQEETFSATPYGREVNDLVRRLVANLPSLEDLATENFEASGLVSAITEHHGHRLHALKFGKWDRGSDYLVLEHLKALQDACVNLKVFSLPLGLTQPEVYPHNLENILLLNLL